MKFYRDAFFEWAPTESDWQPKCRITLQPYDLAAILDIAGATYHYGFNAFWDAPAGYFDDLDPDHPKDGDLAKWQEFNRRGASLHSMLHKYETRIETDRSVTAEVVLQLVAPFKKEA